MAIGILHPIRTAKRLVNTMTKKIVAGIVVVSGIGAGGAMDTADDSVVGQLGHEVMRLVHYAVDQATGM